MRIIISINNRYKNKEEINREVLTNKVVSIFNHFKIIFKMFKTKDMQQVVLIFINTRFKQAKKTYQLGNMIKMF